MATSRQPRETPASQPRATVTVDPRKIVAVGVIGLGLGIIIGSKLGKPCPECAEKRGKHSAPVHRFEPIGPVAVTPDGRPLDAPQAPHVVPAPVPPPAPVAVPLPDPGAVSEPVVTDADLLRQALHMRAHDITVPDPGVSFGGEPSAPIDETGVHYAPVPNSNGMDRPAVFSPMATRKT